MSLENGMMLYHGSYSRIDKIDLNKCADGKDFGKGFYLTDDFDQSRGFIRNSLRKAKNIGAIPKDRNYGYVSVFKYSKSDEDIPIYCFDTADKEWLWFVSMNRRSQLNDRFKRMINPKILKSEIVVGKIANDTTNPTIITYLNGLYGDVESESAINFAIKQLLPERLKNQYYFLSKRAIQCLELVEVIRFE